jgi:hypothetical protein
LPPVTLEGGYDKVRTPQSRGFSLIRPSSTCPRPGLDPASTHRRSAERKGRHGTGLRVFSPSHPLRHHGVKGWPAIPRTRRYNHLHKDRQNFTSRHPGVPVSSYPIKGQARALQEKGATNERTRQDTSQKTRSNEQRHTTHRSTSQAISLYSHFPFETWARFPLSQLVTPTQALRCKEI